jgi:hypothetical protein
VNSGYAPQPGAPLWRPGSCSTRAGHSPPFVLGGIQLSGLPWSLVQARRRPCSALLCAGQPFHPTSVDLRISPSSPLTGRVAFLFRCQPSPVTPLGVVHPAAREELPQEVPVAHPPARVTPSIVICGIKRSFPWSNDQACSWCKSSHW